MSATVLAMTFFVAPAVGNANPVVIVTNSQEPLYATPASYLKNKLTPSHAVRLYSLDGADLAKARQLAETIASKSPRLIIAIGDKAAYLAKKFLAKTPVVFGMVANWESIRFDRRYATGVKYNLEPETVCSQIAMFFPQLRRVGVIYTHSSRSYVELAMKRATLNELKVIPIFVQDPDDFDSALENVVQRVDILWHIKDPLLVTRENLKTLYEVSLKHKRPVVTYSPPLVKGGFLMSITVNGKNVAEQMLAKAEAVLTGTAPSALELSAPLNASVSVNENTLKRLGIKIDGALLDFAQIVKTKKGKK